MAIEVEIQNASESDEAPTAAKFKSWVCAALQGQDEANVLIRIVDAAESSDLNDRYRHKQGPTNVLSFPAELPEEVNLPLLGDIVICAPLVVREARDQGKDAEAHWAHLVIHAVLHLLGHDHQEAARAAEMETLEISLLASLGYPDPYQLPH
jgi:probable rRNA maturation factor